ASRGGFDRIAQGMSGLMSINGDADGPPLVVPIPIADIGTGMFGLVGILAALTHRERTGEGQAVDASLLETPIAWSVYEAAAVWLEKLEAAGVPAGPILTYDQVFADPQVKAREMAVEVNHPTAGRTRVLGVPVKLSKTPGAVRRPAPTLGQHTDEVLGELGYDATAIPDRRTRRVV